MTMRSPIVAMLWEHWRLSRVEAAQRLAQGIVVPSAALTFFDADATVAFWILVATHAFFWFSIAKLNGGRFIDGYKPGFPLYLLYSRPVPTFTIVGVAMVYDAVSCTAFYLVSAAFLRFAFGPPLPLFSVTVFLMAYHFASTCVQWSSRNRVVQWIGSMVTFLPFLTLLQNRVASPLQVEFSLLENALMVLVGVVSFGLTVAGVARQRRSDARAAIPRTMTRSGFSDWLAGLFRVPCPTASATRAQVWFELKSSGLPVLAIGMASAILHPVLFALSGPFGPVRGFAALWAMLSVPTLLVLGGNAFGIRSKQGRVYATAFMATQAYGTARLAVLKVLVRTTCLLVSLIVVGVSLWTSSSLVSGWGKPAPGVLQLRSTFGGAVGAMSASELLGLAVIVSIGIAIMVASRAALGALAARYPRRVKITASLLLLHGLLLVLRAPDGQGGNGLDVLFMDALFGATPWMTAAAIALATIYLFWRSLTEQLLTLRSACGAVVVSAAFGAAWVTVLPAAGVQLAGMSMTNVLWILLLALLPLTVSVLAPWSLSRIRHT